MKAQNYITKVILRDIFMRSCTASLKTVETAYWKGPKPGGDSAYERGGMLVGNFELNP